ncbi:hypothetical protein LX16_0832 [Stackebrandtia albiflava]|uniref:Integral membrane protein n=1 Tax=Stackebrandtia albiflava TaxID=406432 RepID=A0A562VB92_9ACTN|nr:hypothetical protein [Stackebrandtia albiflava]TWJ15133.1 hypothetical protein LX16_0832 [Stackebrandtia albiflava]
MPDPGSATPAPGGTRRREGPGRLLIAGYTLFAVAAGSRAAWQLATDFDAAPLAYTLSAVAAAVYLVAAVGFARDGRTSHRVAVVCCAVELAGVLSVGLFSLFRPDLFPEATVWSRFGSGYFFVPSVLPVLGLWWLFRGHRTARGPA